MGGPCSKYWGEEGLIRGFGLGNLRERDHLEDTGVDGRIIIRWAFKKWELVAWTGSRWVRIGTGGRHV